MDDPTQRLIICLGDRSRVRGASGVYNLRALAVHSSQLHVLNTAKHTNVHHLVCDIPLLSFVIAMIVDEMKCFFAEFTSPRRFQIFPSVSLFRSHFPFDQYTILRWSFSSCSDSMKRLSDTCQCMFGFFITQ